MSMELGTAEQATHTPVKSSMQKLCISCISARAAQAAAMVEKYGCEPHSEASWRAPKRSRKAPQQARKQTIWGIICFGVQLIPVPVN